METVLWIVQIFVCVILIIAVLIQGGENVDITAAFGGVSQAAFGPRGAVSTLAKITWVLFGILVATSTALYIIHNKRSSGSLLGNAPPERPPVSAPQQRPPNHAPANPFQK
jgi:preprotein translocase subunit SecG